MEFRLYESEFYYYFFNGMNWGKEPNKIFYFIKNKSFKLIFFS